MLLCDPPNPDYFAGYYRLVDNMLVGPAVGCEALEPDVSDRPGASDTSTPAVTDDERT